MKKLKIFFGYMVSLLMGFIFTYLLEFSIACILGTTKGAAYSFPEEDLRLYKSFGSGLLVLIIVIFIATETFMKLKIFKGNNILFWINICIVFMESAILYLFFLK